MLVTTFNHLNPMKYPFDIWTYMNIDCGYHFQSSPLYIYIWRFPGMEGIPKWMVYNGKSYWNGWFGGTPILGNFHIYIYISPIVTRVLTQFKRRSSNQPPGRAEGRNLYEVAAEMPFGPIRGVSIGSTMPPKYNFYGWYQKSHQDIGG